MLGDRIAVLDRGRLLQCGTPREIYERPAHRFVATFVGSPPMNLLPVELVADGEHTHVHMIAADRSLSWTMPAGTGLARPARAGQVELGIRPEAIAIHSAEMLSASDASPILDAQVRGLEFNGHEVLATLSFGPHRIVARLPANAPVQERQHVRVRLDLKRAAWFDAGSGTASVSI